MIKLKDSKFTDLYIGDSFIEIKGLFGAGSLLAPAPENLKSDIERLKSICDEFSNRTGRKEFSVEHDGVIYRVTLSVNYSNKINYVIRQTPHEIMPIANIGVPSEFIKEFKNRQSVGLVLIAGKMGVGKTTTAASILSHRTASLGDLSVSIEDPIETKLEGKHGVGRCIQLEVNDEITYPAALKTAMRMGAGNLLIGEIRDSESALEALKAGLNGMFVIATIHANGIADAIERFDILCSAKTNNSRASISRALSFVLNQSMEYPQRDGKVIGRNVTIHGFNLLDNHIENQVKAAISSGNFSSLSEIIKANKNRKIMS